MKFNFNLRKENIEYKKLIFVIINNLNPKPNFEIEERDDIININLTFESIFLKDEFIEQMRKNNIGWSLS